MLGHPEEVLQWLNAFAQKGVLKGVYPVFTPICLQGVMNAALPTVMCSSRKKL
jgi:hypothetical protein